MSTEEFLCVRCARHTKTCCQRSEIYTTPGDERRIREYSGRANFTEFRVPDNPEYLDQDDDSVWQKYVFRVDNSRRVLRRQPDGDCTFLGEQGCTLPLETRPLVCRLYPFDYTADGISDDLADGCPLELLPAGTGLIEALDMKLEDARRWHRQLYEEIREETQTEATMLIGLTYDLRDEYLAAGYSDEETAEFDRAETINAIEGALQTLGYETDRIGHARRLVERLAQGDRWDLIFNICEGLHGTGREAQVPAILDVYEIPGTFGDPCTMSVCLDKGVTKSVIQNSLLPTPRFVVIEHLGQVRDVQLSYPLFAKPLAEGTSKGVTPASRVESPQQLEEICETLLQRYEQPVIVEEYLPGREFTLGLLGTGEATSCLGTLEIVLRDQAEPGVYSYVNKENCEELVEYRIVKASDDPCVAEAEQIALSAWKVLNGRDAGRVDLRCDADGNPCFLEANPLAGLHPSHSDLPMLATAAGMPYVELIRHIVESAAKRCSSFGRSSSHRECSPVMSSAEGDL